MICIIGDVVIHIHNPTSQAAVLLITLLLNQKSNFIGNNMLVFVTEDRFLYLS